MPLPRTAPLRSLSRVRPTRNVPHSRPWPRAQQQRRTYADAKESAKAAKDTIKGATDGVKGSDMPWLAGAILVTVPASYLVAKSGPMTNPFTHPLPGDHYHGEHGEHDDDDEEHEDAEGEEDSEESDEGKQSEGGDSDEESSSSNDGDNDTPATSDDDDSDPAPGEEKRTSQPGKSIPGASSSQQSEELPSGPDGQTRLLIPSAKGGNKKRVESSKGIVQGQSENADDDDDEGRPTSASSSEQGSIGDVKDGSKSAAAGQVKGQQKGVSNTDTKHSTDQMKNPEASKKPEGVPETAKIQGTVDPRR